MSSESRDIGAGRISGSTARLNAVAEALPDLMFILDEDGRHIDIVTSQKKLLYRSVERIQGKLLHEIFEESLADRCLELVQKILKTRGTGRMEYDLEIAGEHRCFEAHVAPLDVTIDGKACVVWIARDTTESKRFQTALRENQERLRAILESLPDLVLVVDESGIYREILHTDSMLLSVEASELVGKRIDDLFSKQTAELFRSTLERTLRTGKPQLIEYQLEVNAGHRWFESRTAPLNVLMDGKRCIVVSARDITDSKRAEGLQKQNIYLKEELSSALNAGKIVGKSAVITELLESVRLVAETDSTVLLTGETGTGKELVARAIHDLSPRRDQTMVRVNCGALPEGLVESELFGHEKGAFTGATSKKIGRFELADGGTMFLDEVGDLPQSAQVKLLRVLQEKEFERVGGDRTLTVDVRLVAASNKDLAEEVKEGRFRADLFYRLEIFPLTVPPLRDRVEDIPVLAEHFVAKFAGNAGKKITTIDPSAIAMLMEHDWPGNVRELANIIERAVILCQGSILRAQHIRGLSKVASAGDSGFIPLDEMERRHILEALAKTNGKVAGPDGAAKLLNINRSTLWHRMKKLGIDSNGGKQRNARM